MARTILYLQSTSEIGGSDIALLRLVRGLFPKGYKLIVVLPSGGPLVSLFESAGCRVLIVPAMLQLTTTRGKLYFLHYLVNYPRAVWRIWQIARRERADLVHTNSLHNLYGFVVAWLSSRTHVWHVREIVWQSQIMRRVELFLARHFADRILAVSQSVAAMFDDPGCARAHLNVIPDGVDLQCFRPDIDGAGIFEDLGLAVDTPLVGLVCRWDPWKGVEVFVRAAAACHVDSPQVRFVIVGGPVPGREAYVEQMVRLADDLGLRGVVYFTGWRYGPDDMPRVYAALTVLVVSSTRPEAQGLVLLEAMATGKPVIAVNEGGPAEMCVDGETGLLVAARDAGALSQAMLTLLRDPTTARRMGAAGRRRAEQWYGQDNYVRQIERLYHELLVGPPAPPCP